MWPHLLRMWRHFLSLISLCIKWQQVQRILCVHGKLLSLLCPLASSFQYWTIIHLPFLLTVEFEDWFRLTWALTVLSTLGKKSHRSSGCLWKAISSVPASLITPQPWHSGSFILNCVSKLWRVNNKEGRVADFVWKGAQRKQAHSDRSTENHVALGSDKLKAHLKNRSFL